MQDKNKRKEWIKTFAIIFLSILLILTFFSNTIQNYSLPEVAAQYTWSGSITKKVRGEGTIEASAPYSVQYTRSRKIANVAVKVGDTVEKGDVLYTLEEGVSKEIKEKEKSVTEKKREYEAYIVDNEISVEMKNNVEKGELQTLDDIQTERDNLQKKIDSLQKKYDAAKAASDAFQTAVSEEDTTVTEVKTKKDAEALESAWEEQNSINLEAWNEIGQTKYDQLSKTYNAKLKAYEKIKDSTTATKAEKKTAKQEYADAKDAFDEADAVLKAYKNGISQLAAAKENVKVADKAISEKTKALEADESKLEEDLKTAEESFDKIKNGFSTQNALLSLYSDYLEEQKELDELVKTEGGNEITAPVAGTVLTLSYVAGQTVEVSGDGETASGEVATIQLAGKGYTLSMTVTAEQATLLRVGDEAEVTNSWWYSDVHAKVTSIRPDRDSQGKNKIVTFDVEGDVTAGQTLTLTVGQRTATYDNVVPNSAVREDNKGKFVYRVTSKSTPLGSRYYAERVDVTVLAEDETQTAINGTLESWEYIITTSSKPISDGQQIRLKD